VTLAARVIPFVKAGACGNDFLIVDYADPDRAYEGGIDELSGLGKLSRRLCDRHTGVGADGVEWLFPAPDADVRARLINADGSEAEISGNGTRCVAAYLCAEQKREQVMISTGAGVKRCTLSSRAHASYEFEIAMGRPEISGELTLKLVAREVRGIPVSMGNPHYVVFVDGFGDHWQAEGAKIQQQKAFPQGVNVEFVRIRDAESVEVRFFERGAGETQSSGTGSCAAAVAAISSQRARSPVRVHAPGGIQTVRWDDQVFLTGSAQLICRGEFFV
jgi:diaminopimelate epimerase